MTDETYPTFPLQDFLGFVIDRGEGNATATVELRSSRPRMARGSRLAIDSKASSSSR